MLTGLTEMGKKKLFLLISLFIVLLIAGRLVWLDFFMIKEQPYAVDGVLDLREWDASKGKAITLDGEWALYPFTLLEDYDDTQETESRRLINVPGGWNTTLQDEVESPYGYGTYHLRVLVNPEERHSYSIFIPSVRSSSQLFINGSKYGSSGQPAEIADEYKANNVAYTVTFTADQEGVIDVILQAANFLDSRSSGLVRSMKFGTDEAVQKERQLSVSMQFVVVIALLIHSIYTIILFFMNRDKKLLYFSLLLFCTMFILLNSSEDKILQSWIEIDYEFSFKLVFFEMIIIIYSMIQCTINFFPVRWKQRILTYSTIVCVAVFLLMIILPNQLVITVGNSLMYTAFIMAILIVFFMLKSALTQLENNLLLILSIISFIHYFLWWNFFLISGMKVVFYPFDLLIALILFSVTWFQRYFHIFEEQKKMTAELKQIDKVKDEFLVNTSHELRNPLHGILNISQVVLEREKDALSAKSIKDLQMVHTVGRRMSLLLNDLLDVTRLQEGGIQLQLRSVSIQTVASGVIDMIVSWRKGSR